MDPHFSDISIALYRQETDEGTAYLIRTYSAVDGVAERIEFAKQAMATLGTMESTNSGLLRFPCHEGHGFSVKRLFLEACKIVPDSLVEVRPMDIFDKKADCQIVVSSLGKGVYKVHGEGKGKRVDSRVRLIIGGLMKLGEMEERGIGLVAFPCGRSHDSLVGLLLVRALNVRAVFREEEAGAARGVLAAPSQQR
jgi:hypothetical protein